MSGWDPGRLGEITFGLFIVATGVRQVVGPALGAASGLDGRRAGPLKLRYGSGGTDLPTERRSTPDWMTGFMVIGGGLLIALTSRPDHSWFQTAFMLVMGAILFPVALLELVGLPRARARRHWLDIAFFGVFGAAFLTLGLLGLRQ